MFRRSMGRAFRRSNPLTARRACILGVARDAPTTVSPGQFAALQQIRERHHIKSDTLPCPSECERRMLNSLGDRLTYIGSLRIHHDLSRLLGDHSR
jgi:hypothetical protein